MKRFFDWLAGLGRTDKAAPRTRIDPGAPPRSKPGVPTARPRPPASRPAVTKRQPKPLEIDPHVEGRIEELGPGKNVLIRNKMVREVTGTHDTLQILDDSILDNDDEAGIDPYNTGQFDRSKNWDKRRN